MQVYFETNQQASRVMEIIAGHSCYPVVEPYIDDFRGDAVISLCLEDEYRHTLLVTLRDSFLTLVRTEILQGWLERILEEDFRYSDRTERQYIIEIALSIMQEQGHKNDMFWQELKFKIHHGLLSLFERKVSFSFPSFLQFRMRGVADRLNDYAETALDEYKMEQEYQSFIQILRNHMLCTETKLEQLHVKHHHSFEFYTMDFMHLTRGEITGFIDRKLISEYPMYIDSHVLAPLISIAPKQLYVYSDEANHPLIMTIQRIFEERVITLPADHFGQKQLNSLS
ncbi:MAG: putative sporulation protein YtxC [Bacillus sp. (in: firmicutes)]